MADGLVTLRTPGASDPSVGDVDSSRPFGVYVHFPFCSVHCPYCDFAVDTRAEIPHDQYADAVIAELGARAAWFRGDGRTGGTSPHLVSIYFGGGTPGLWKPDALGRVIDVIRAAFGADDPAALEITLEANPGEVQPEAATAWRRVGVNRLSLGVQSFDDATLARIGRNHDGQAGRRAVEISRAAEFANISCDLMFGLPGQALDDWKRSVDMMVALAPEHVSAYALTVERGTPFGSLDRAGKLERPDDETAAGMFTQGRDALAAAGYSQYEVSSHAWPGKRAVHNTLYWTGGSYLGLGASASSFRPLDDGTGWRFSNPRGTDKYLRSVAAGAGTFAPAQTELRARDDLENEGAWLALRTADGIDRAHHARRFGQDVLAAPARASAAAGCAAAGWLTILPDRVRLTDTGWLFADEVAARLWR